MSQEELEKLIRPEVIEEEASNKNDEEIVDKVSSKEALRLKALQDEFIARTIKVKLNETTYQYKNKQ